MNYAFSIPHIDNFPRELDDTERDQIKAAEIRAARVVAIKKSSILSTAEKEAILLRDWVLPIFAAFSNVAFNRAKAGSWPIHKADLESREFLDSLAAKAGMNSPDAWMADGGHIIRAEMRNDIEHSAEWARHQEKLLELTDAPDNATIAELEAPNGGEPGKSQQPGRPSVGIAEAAMVDLPELSESTKRKLSIKWDDMLAEARFTGQHFEWHAKAPKFGHVKVMIGDVDTGQRLSIPVKVERIGVNQSVSVAKGRFRDLAQEYWLLWQASGTGWETCKAWVDSLRQRVLREVASLWKGRSDAIDRWYERVCRPAIEDTLTECVDERVREARAVELQRLERGSPEPITVTGNPILDGSSERQPAEVANGTDNDVTLPGVLPGGKGRKRGPKPDHEGAAHVAEIVARVAPDGDWRSKLDELGEALDHGVCNAPDPNTCDASDHEKIPVPRGWSVDGNDWLTPPDRATMVKAIEYRLETARQKPITETLS